jgi:adenylosuccinate synthase
VNEKITPIYEELKGWNTPLNRLGTSTEDLPVELNDYISFLEHQLRVPITMVSTGPDRTQTVYRQLDIA